MLLRFLGIWKTCLQNDVRFLQSFMDYEIVWNVICQVISITVIFPKLKKEKKKKNIITRLSNRSESQEKTIVLYFKNWCSIFSSVTQPCPSLCDPMDCSTPGFPVHQQLLELARTHIHWVCDAIQPSHPLSSPSPSASNLSQHQGLFQWVSSLHQVAKVLEFQLQHQFFQWISRTDFL